MDAIFGPPVKTRGDGDDGGDFQQYAYLFKFIIIGDEGQ